MTIEVGELLPSYLTVDPVTGEVSAKFTGSIDLPENPSTNAWTPGHAVTWRDANGVVQEFVQGSKTALHQLIAGSGPFTRTIIAENGSSSFVVGGGIVDAGSEVIPFAAQTSVSRTVLYGLGGNPATTVVATPQAIVGRLIANTDTFTATDFRLTLVADAAVTGSFEVSWIAWAPLP